MFWISFDNLFCKWFFFQSFLLCVADESKHNFGKTMLHTMGNGVRIHIEMVSYFCWKIMIFLSFRQDNLEEAAQCNAADHWWICVRQRCNHVCGACTRVRGLETDHFRCTFQTQRGVRVSSAHCRQTDAEAVLPHCYRYSWPAESYLTGVTWKWLWQGRVYIIIIYSQHSQIAANSRSILLPCIEKNILDIPYFRTS